MSSTSWLKPMSREKILTLTSQCFIDNYEQILSVNFWKSYTFFLTCFEKSPSLHSALSISLLRLKMIPTRKNLNQDQFYFLQFCPSRVKTKTSAKYGLSAQPRLVDIIAAVPSHYRRALVPKLKAKPIRTASGVRRPSTCLVWFADTLFKMCWLSYCRNKTHTCTDFCDSL